MIRLHILPSLLVAVFCAPQVAYGKTVVTTYVVETQEKRHSTRWTLTEWLRIKERIRLMDLWLALVSDPKKEKFAPELSLGYKSLSGEMKLSSDINSTPTLFESQSAQSGRIQFWFTNLISSTTGLKTPNVDLGFDYGAHRGSDPAVGEDQYDTGAQVLTLSKRSYSYTTVNFRIFGKNIQDTSLVLKYGQYQTSKGFDDSLGELDENVSGLVAGAESYFYMLKWLGLEGNYLKFGNDKGPAGSEEVSGELFDYGIFIEVYNLRVGYGEYEEEWEWQTPSYDLKYERRGQAVSVKLNF
ncbi:hypothetical protein [Pseudobacteriovorax antillogorgiicola]|uniref:Secreted protein n=1 Tax=Pseudobacteriovorax antillogorgiicola TaxID=1513793 RepID=A0A1Y6B786_9BACT|nr:hypothetical protein [Pseudobacteriovorax antillogorgiicola]TCS58629.1 hypothetical protein EDD56_102142 [Pseudobacteriovorax antillogorgiicola]SME96625.1 hypothetical protein SAMN06296036_102301 [Pseudobacteriovorax antillogorgiicola]